MSHLTAVDSDRNGSSAQCHSCLWEGPIRNDLTTAQADALAHVLEESQYRDMQTRIEVEWRRSQMHQWKTAVGLALDSQHRYLQGWIDALDWVLRKGEEMTEPSTEKLLTCPDGCGLICSEGEMHVHTADPWYAQKHQPNHPMYLGRENRVV